MKTRVLFALPVMGIAALAMSARGNTANFAINGTGISGSGTITYTPQSGGAGTITGITGSFSDTNASISGTISGLYAIGPINPLPPNVSAPDFSQYAVANGVPSTPPSNALSYDNNFYPGGSPSVCRDYPFFGGALDVYGVLFTLSDGHVVDLWSNGAVPGAGGATITYGAAVADATSTYDYASNLDFTYTLVPEPGSFSIAALVLGGMVLRRRKRMSVA